MLDEVLRIRGEFKANDDRRDAGLGTPEDVERFDGISYGGDPLWQVLDVYRPRGAGASPLPVIVNVHGGGWVYGTKETYQFYCMDLCRRGFAVVNFTYRLAPEHPFPASLEDTCLAFKWVLENAGMYGFDKKRVFAVGDSAGGHLLALFCEMCADPEYAGNWPFSPPPGFIPSAVALNCGSYHHELSDGGGDGDLLIRVMGDRASKSFVELADAARHVTGRFPPAFLMTSNGDFLKNDALMMAGSLMAASVPFELHFYGGAGSTLGHVFHVDIRKPEAAVCNGEECAFFKKHI